MRNNGNGFLRRLGRLPEGYDTAGMTPEQIARLERRRGWGQIGGAFGDAADTYGEALREGPPERADYARNLATPSLPMGQQPTGGISFSQIRLRPVDRRQMLIDALQKG